MNCDKYSKWDKNNWNNWNGIGPNTLATMVPILVEIIITNGIIVITNTITAMTIRIN